MKTIGTSGTTKGVWEAYIHNVKENGGIPINLELAWLILVHIYVLMELLVDDHPNIVQHTQILIILAYVGIIEPKSWFSGPPWCLGGCHLLIDPI